MASCEKKYTILLLSAPIGSGHKLAAQALEQSFALADNVQVVHGSILTFFRAVSAMLFYVFIYGYSHIVPGCMSWLINGETVRAGRYGCVTLLMVP
jgi:hypothetical protein